MATKDLHEEPFDESTIAKLEIFEDYAQEWIPTFVMQDGFSTICIFDFFAGTGYDKNGIPGSPIRILRKIKEQIGNIFQKRVKVKVFFNEFDKEKFVLLEKACQNYLDDNKDVKRAIELTLFNDDFEILFPKCISEINVFPSLVYLDQNGVKFLSNKYLLQFEKMKQTDFLYFVSSSYFLRFGNSKEFKEHVDIDMDLARTNPYQYIHRFIISELRKKLPLTSKLKLYPFSLKKGSNIYGIIFGASHPRAVDKFLTLSWKRNEVNGEANFDIFDDTPKPQLGFWPSEKLNKIQNFQKKVKELVLSKKITDNYELYHFVLEEGHIGSHAAECLKRMKKDGLINYNSISPLITYDNVYKLRKKISYQINTHETK